MEGDEGEMKDEKTRNMHFKSGSIHLVPSKHEHGDSQAFFLDLVVFFCLQDTKF